MGDVIIGEYFGEVREIRLENFNLDLKSRGW